jgi:hypothetical protein
MEERKHAAYFVIHHEMDNEQDRKRERRREHRSMRKHIV